MAAVRDRVPAKTRVTSRVTGVGTFRRCVEGEPCRFARLGLQQARCWMLQQPRAITGGAYGHSMAQDCNHPPVHMLQTSTAAKGTSSRSDQWTAVGDSLELERDSLRVVWPSLPRAPARPAKPTPMPGCARASGPEPAPEVAAALKELEKLRACGLAVGLFR